MIFKGFFFAVFAVFVSSCGNFRGILWRFFILCSPVFALPINQVSIFAATKVVKKNKLTTKTAKNYGYNCKMARFIRQFDPETSPRISG